MRKRGARSQKCRTSMAKYHSDALTLLNSALECSQGCQKGSYYDLALNYMPNAGGRIWYQKAAKLNSIFNNLLEKNWPYLKKIQSNWTHLQKHWIKIDTTRKGNLIQKCISNWLVFAVKSHILTQIVYKFKEIIDLWDSRKVWVKLTTEKTG